MLMPSTAMRYISCSVCTILPISIFLVLAGDQLTQYWIHCFTTSVARSLYDRRLTSDKRESYAMVLVRDRGTGGLQVLHYAKTQYLQDYL